MRSLRFWHGARASAPSKGHSQPDPHGKIASRPTGRCSQRIGDSILLQPADDVIDRIAHRTAGLHKQVLLLRGCIADELPRTVPEIGASGTRGAHPFLAF